MNETTVPQPDVAPPFAHGDRVQLIQPAMTTTGDELDVGDTGTVYQWSAPDRLGVYFNRLRGIPRTGSPPIFDVIYKGEQVDVLAICEHIPAEHPTPATPDDDLNLLRAARDHWREEHHIEHARRIQLQRELQALKARQSLLMVELNMITDMIETETDLHWNHSQRTGAAKLWRAMLAKILNRHVDLSPTTPADPEEIPF